MSSTTLIPSFPARDERAPRPGRACVERNEVAAVVRRREDGPYLVLHLTAVGRLTFVTGALEPGEEPQVAAQKHVLRAAGYKNLRLIEILPPFETTAYDDHSGENCRTRVQSFLYELVDEERGPATPETLAAHTVHWLDEFSLFREHGIPEGHQFLLDHMSNTT